MSDTAPVPFVIVADVRTGSTMLSSTLERHPAIRCRGELFHPEDFPDNQVPGGPRHALTAETLIERAFSDRSAQAEGFRAMVFHPDPEVRPRWTHAWDVLAARPGLRVIFLWRRDPLAQLASWTIARETGCFTPPPGDPLYEAGNRPRVRIAPDELRRWTDDRVRLYARRREQLRGRPALDLTYEDLTGHWAESIERIEDFLGVAHQPLEPAKLKQEHRPLSESVVNYAELQQSLANRPA